MKYKMTSINNSTICQVQKYIRAQIFTNFNHLKVFRNKSLLRGTVLQLSLHMRHCHPKDLNFVTWQRRQFLLWGLWMSLYSLCFMSMCGQSMNKVLNTHCYFLHPFMHKVIPQGRGETAQSHSSTLTHGSEFQWQYGSITFVLSSFPDLIHLLIVSLCDSKGNRQEIYFETFDSWLTSPGNQPQRPRHDVNECSMRLHQLALSCTETQIQLGSAKMCSYLSVHLTDWLKKWLSIRPPLLRRANFTEERLWAGW